MSVSIRRIACAFLCGVAVTAKLAAQQTTIATPFQSSNNSFYENFGIGFGFNIPTAGGRGVVGFGPGGVQQGIGFGFGGPNVAPPPFGMGQPFNGGQLGYGVNGPRGGFNLNFFGEQGSSTSNVSQTPFVTSMNGYPAYFSDTIQRPFVTGLIPVVGDYGAGFAGPTVVYPNVVVPGFGQPTQRTSVVNERWERLQAEAKTAPRVQPTAAAIPQPDDGALRLKRAPVAGEAAGGSLTSDGGSSAERATLSLAEIRRQNAAKQAETDAEHDELLDRARAAVADNRIAAAKTLYERVLKSGNPAQRATATTELQALTTR